MREFDAKVIKDELIAWIKDWFEKNGNTCKAVIGISGGKDSSVVAALCVEALGKDRVLGVLMPQGKQHDINASYDLVRHLGIDYTEINIGETVTQLFEALTYFPLRTSKGNIPLVINTIAKTNTPARIRMTTLYAVSACVNGRVANTCNLSENTVSYSTKYGDAAGDFSPLEDLTVTEVKKIGYELGLPEHLINKVPEDGLCGKTDEDNLGFTYDVLDRYIREGVCEDEDVKTKIENMKKSGLHKLRIMDGYKING